MDLPRLIEVLSASGAYPHPVEAVEVRQTHISVVFLAGPFAYKIKKPVNLGFLDFSTLEKRRHFCEEEVRLNRRLAPAVYLGVVPITRSGAASGRRGRRSDRVGRENGAAAGRRDARSPAPPRRDWTRASSRHWPAGSPLSCARPKRARTLRRSADSRSSPRNARENFEQAAAQVGTTVSRAVFERLRALTDRRLPACAARSSDRAARRAARHPRRPAPGSCLPLPGPKPPATWSSSTASNSTSGSASPTRGRHGVPGHGSGVPRPARSGPRLRRRPTFEAAGDDEGRALLPFYTAYRAAVRAKVEGLSWPRRRFPRPSATRWPGRARAHWLLALGELEDAGRRPCLVLVGGLPGTGKSTLRAGLAERATSRSIRSDVVRKELAGRRSDPRPAAYDEGIYTPAVDERPTPSACAGPNGCCSRGSGSSWTPASRKSGRGRCSSTRPAAGRSRPALAVRGRSVRGAARLEDRRGDASDADWGVHLQTAAEWDEPGPATRETIRTLSTNDGRERGLPPPWRS